MSESDARHPPIPKNTIASFRQSAGQKNPDKRHSPARISQLYNKETLQLQLHQPVISRYLIDNRPHDNLQTAPRTIVGRRHKVHPMLFDQLSERLPHLLVRGIIDGYRMAVLLFDQPHTGDIRSPVTNIYHMGKRYGPLFFGDITVHRLRVVDTVDTLADFEDELGFVGVVHRHSRPLSHPVYGIEECTGKNLFEMAGNGGSLNHLLESRRIDIVFNLHPARVAIPVDAPEPTLHPLEQLHLAARLGKGRPFERHPVGLGLTNHLVHIGQDGVRVIFERHPVAGIPKLPVILPDSRNKVVFLHIARRECAVEVVYQSQYHTFMRFAQI